MGKERRRARKKGGGWLELKVIANKKACQDKS
jgi:hypothetical protein